MKSLDEILVDLSDHRAWVREAAARELGLHPGPRAVEALLPIVMRARHVRPRALDVTEFPVLLAAVRALGLIGDPHAAGPLIALLDWDSPDVTSAVALALAAIGDPRGVAPLARTLAQGDETGRSASAYALGKVGGGDAVPPLIRALGDPSPEVARAAVEALAGLGEGGIARAVEAALSSRDGRTAMLPDMRAAVPLLRALAHPDPDTRDAAAGALAVMPAPDASTIADAVGECGEEEQHAVAEGLARMGSRMAGVLRAVLVLPSRPAQCVAAEALGLLGAAAASAQGHLRRAAAQDESPDERLRGICQDALWRITVALHRAPSELEAAMPPRGTGTEPEAADAPPGRGTEPEAAEPPTMVISRRIVKRRRKPVPHKREDAIIVEGTRGHES